MLDPDRGRFGDEDDDDDEEDDAVVVVVKPDEEVVAGLVDVVAGDAEDAGCLILVNFNPAGKLG